MEDYVSIFLEWVTLCVIALWCAVKGKTFASISKYSTIALSRKTQVCSQKQSHIYRSGNYSDSMQQSVNPRVYTPLPQNFIRLLVLYSGKPGSPIRGYLITNRFERKTSRKSYEALSYVWGNSCRQKFMTLNDEHFPINQNLHAALQHLRSATSNRTLWIDAICINQNDETERNRQVALMGDIYMCAGHVVNWLGPPTSNTALGLQILAFLFGDKDISFQPPWEIHKSSLLRAGLQDILERDYFKRIWVVQENALASKITLQIGSTTLTWRSGAETHRAICRIKFAVISPSWEAAGLRDIDVRPLLEILEQNMMVTRRNLGKACRQVTILDQAFDMRYRRATDRRDMIYALRSMIPEEMRGDLVVDYGKSVDELYAQFYKEVEKAYQGEMDFVRHSEKERLKRERQRIERIQIRGGW